MTPARRFLATGLLALVTTTACGRGERTSSVDAARADSSAAGYTVGEAAAPATVPIEIGRGTVVAPTSVATATQRDTAVAPTTATVRPNATPVGPAGAPLAAARADTLRAAVGRVRQQPPPEVKAGSRIDSTPPPPVIATGPVRVNEFLTYDARSRTVSLQLIAGYNGLNGSLNYNGSTNGNHGIRVPVGWRIHVTVSNRDSDLQHSAIVVTEVLPPPIEPAHPAFAGAALPQLGEGLHEDETGTLDFVADRTGRYMIACGVPGHAQAGMWLQLAVANIPVPGYR